MCGGKFIHIAGFIAVAGAVRFGVPAVEGILIKSKAEEAVSSYLNFGSAGILAPESVAYGVFRACAAVAPIDNGVCTLWLPGGGIGDVFGYGLSKIGSPCFELPAGIFGKVALECRGGFAGFYGIFFGFKGFAGNAVNIFYGKVFYFPLGSIGSIFVYFFSYFGFPAEEVISLAGGSAGEHRSGFAVANGISLVVKSFAGNAVCIDNSTLKFKIYFNEVCYRSGNIACIFRTRNS